MSNGAQKKGLGPLAWIAIGCGGLIVIGLVIAVVAGVFVAKKGKDFLTEMEKNPGLTTARTIVRLNPELEEVGVDEDNETITVRNTKTGEEYTFDWSDVKDGKLRFKSGEKEVTFDAQQDGEGGTLKVSGGDEGGGFELSTGNAVTEPIPDWVPVPDGAEPTNRHSMTLDKGLNGGFQLDSKLPVADVLDFYRERLEAAGYTASVNTFDGEGGTGGMVNGNDANGGRSVVVMARSEDGTTTVTVSYHQE